MMVRSPTYHISRLWNDELNKHRIKKILRRKIYGQWRFLRQCIKYMNIMVNKHSSDHEIYTWFHQICDTHTYFEEKTYNRALSRLNDIKRFIIYHDNYLDIGCLDGTITRNIHEYLQTKNPCAKTVGIDVNDVIESDMNGCRILKYDGNKIPFEDNTFDLITLFMVLHHVEHVTDYLKEVYRVMCPGGSLIIREHDINNQDIKDMVDIQHNFYNMDSAETMPTHQYKSKEQWNNILNATGFTLVSVPVDCSSYLERTDKNIITIRNPFQIFYSVYVK